jgi:divalent metal cation (Fe/Co/Zn/Cd) transporter
VDSELLVAASSSTLVVLSDIAGGIAVTVFKFVVAAITGSVVRARRPLTMYFGPDQILVALDIQFSPGLTSQEMEKTVDRIESAVRLRVPQVRYIFLEAESITARAAPDRGG